MIDNVRGLSDEWQGASSISLFLKTDIEDTQAKAIEQRVAAFDSVANTQLITKAQALKEFKERSGFGAALDLLKDNPLPNVIVITPNEENSTPMAAKQLLSQLKTFREVDSAQLDLEWVQRLAAITDLFIRGVLVLAALLGAGVLLIVGNTIRLEVQHRHSEIEIMKLVGATDRFIRRPFLYEGLWYGLLGGIAALIMSIVALWLLSGPVEQISGLYNSNFALDWLSGEAFLLVFFGSPLLGLAGALLALTRHLRMIQPD
jgi:cell division transport system permease protein